MNHLNKLYLSLATIVSFSCLGMQLVREENDYRFHDGKQEHVVKSHFVDPLLKRMNPEQLTKFVEQGNRIRNIRFSDGERRLQAMVPGKGGGPIGFAIGYGITKTLCWSGLIGAGVGAAAATGGAVLGAAGLTGAAVAATGGAAATATGALAATGSAIAGSVGVAGAGTVAGAAAVGASAGFTAGAAAATTIGTAVATGATLTGGAAVAAAGAAEVAGTVVAAGGIIASIETASLCVGAWLGALTGPF